MADLIVTEHFIQRASQRGLRPDVFWFIVAHGTEVHACDATSLTVLRKALPPDLRDAPLARRARDWIVVTSREGALITCYRRGRASQFLRRKPKRSASLRAARHGYEDAALAA